MGKCNEKGNLIRVRNKRTGEIEEITVKDFHERIKAKKEGQ